MDQVRERGRAGHELTYVFTFALVGGGRGGIYTGSAATRERAASSRRGNDQARRPAGNPGAGGEGARHARRRGPCGPRFDRRRRKCKIENAGVLGSGGEHQGRIFDEVYLLKYPRSTVLSVGLTANQKTRLIGLQCNGVRLAAIHPGCP